MPTTDFNATFWDWAAYDLNSIDIAAQERWMNARGCPLDLNETAIDRLRSGLATNLKATNPLMAQRLGDMLETLDKYRGDHGIGNEEAMRDTSTVCGAISEIMSAIPELQARRITLKDWVDNGNDRKVAILCGKSLPALLLNAPAAA